MASHTQEHSVESSSPDSAPMAAAPQTPDRHYIDDLELQMVLNQHKKWLQSDKQEGKRASLEGRTLSRAGQPPRNLVNIDLRDANLREIIVGPANLYGADLRSADLTGAQFDSRTSLQMVDFRGCVLSGVNFGDANVKDARFRNASLQDADLSSVRNLLPMQLAATNLTRTLLPEGTCPFPGIAQVDKITYLGRSTFLMLLTASIFAVFVVGTTEDVELLTGSAAETLPIINFELPLIEFIHVVPLFILALYLYLTLYLVSLMNELAELPVIFPDGRTLDQHVEPWIMTSLLYKNISSLKDRRPNLSYLRQYGAIASGWFIAPVILFSVWWYYIRAHVWWSSIFHAIVFVASAFLGIVTYRIAAGILRGEYHQGSLQSKKHFRTDVSLHIIGLVILLSATIGLTHWAIYSPRIENPYTDITNPADDQSRIGTQTSGGKSLPSVESRMSLSFLIQSLQSRLENTRFLEITGRDVTERPVIWSDPVKTNWKDEYHEMFGNWTLSKEASNNQLKTIEELKDWRNNFIDFYDEALGSSGVNPVNLSNRDLRRMEGSDSFLARSDFSNTDLRGAQLSRTDLRGANMSGVNAIDAIFVDADMQGVNLTMAKLQGANLQGANLRGANLYRLNYIRTDETENTSNQKGGVINLTGVNLQHANLNEAVLNDAVMVKATLSYATLTMAHMKDAKLPDADLSHAILSGANMENAVLVEAKFIGSDLSQTTRTQVDKSRTAKQITYVTNFQGAELVKAKFASAKLTGANFASATLTGADFDNAILNNTDLSEAKGLTQDQLDGACGNDSTLLPAGLTIKNCPKMKLQ